MGDEMHQRNVACSALFLRDISPLLARTATDNDTLADVLRFIGKNDQFFLNIAMAMGKSMTDPAHGIEASTIVTAMCRNGSDFGVRVSGTGEQRSEEHTSELQSLLRISHPVFCLKKKNPQ